MIRLALAALLVTTLFHVVEPAKADTRKPNIVFFLFDDMGWGQPQSYNPQFRVAHAQPRQAGVARDAIYGRAHRPPPSARPRATAC